MLHDPLTGVQRSTMSAPGESATEHHGIAAECLADTSSVPAHPARQRIDSEASVSSKATEGRSVLDRLDQRGGAKVRLPQRAASALEAVLINTAGGLTGDDRIVWNATAGVGTRLAVSTAASEKAYRSHGPYARQHTTLTVEADAWLAWLPQETIVFDGAALERQLDVRLAANASCLLCEALVFGRRASGERVGNAQLNDQWRIWRNGDLLHAEALRIDAAKDLAPGAGLTGLGTRFTSMATLVFCPPWNQERLENLAERLRRDVSAAPDTLCGTSALPGRLVVRVLAMDSARLRGVLLPLLDQLLQPEQVPKVWYV